MVYLPLCLLCCISTAVSATVPAAVYPNLLSAVVYPTLVSAAVYPMLLSAAVYPTLVSAAVYLPLCILRCGSAAVYLPLFICHCVSATVYLPLCICHCVQCSQPSRPSEISPGRTDGAKAVRLRPSSRRTECRPLSTVIGRLLNIFRLNPIKPDNVIQASECMKSWCRGRNL